MCKLWWYPNPEETRVKQNSTHYTQTKKNENEKNGNKNGEAKLLYCLIRRGAWTSSSPCAIHCLNFVANLPNSSWLWTSINTINNCKFEQPMKFHGPRRFRKQKQPWDWSGGIIPPPFDVSIASIRDTTSSISGRLSGFASQHRFITFASELGQHLGISGLRFCIQWNHLNKFAKYRVHKKS